MRDLNECKAEIFRRSQNRIAARRRARMRIVILCLPICLGLSILSVSSISKVLSNSSGTNAMEIAPDAGVGGISGFSSVQIFKAGISVQNITVSEKASAIYEAVMELYSSTKTGASDNHSDILINENKGENTPDEYHGSCNEYEFHFTSVNGAEIRFVLNNNELYDVNNGRKLYLTENQLRILLDLTKQVE